MYCEYNSLFTMGDDIQVVGETDFVDIVPADKFQAELVLDSFGNYLRQKRFNIPDNQIWI